MMSSCKITGLLLLFIADYATAKSALGGACQVRFGDTNLKYFETGLGNQRCDTDLICITEVDNGMPQIDFPGQCEESRCFGSLDGSNIPDTGDGRVTICHRTCSETNPWVRITIDASAWSDFSCKHGQHTINTCNGKNLTLWGDNTDDYVLKYHGTKAEVAARLNGVAGDINSYWNHWESACPSVRNGACCDFQGEFGYSCCPGYGDLGPDDFTSAPTNPPTSPPTPPPTPPPTLPPPTPAPTPAPTPSPTPAPTPQPTPAPVLVTPPPAPAPTQAPVAENIPEDPAPGPDCRRRLQLGALAQKWNISEPTFDYEALTFDLDFEVSDFVASVDMVQFTLYEQTCTTPYTGPGLSGSKGALSPSIDNAAKQIAPISVTIDSSTIATDSQVYSEPGFLIDNQQTANVDFCLRFGLHTPPAAGSDVEVNYLEVIVRLDVDLTDGFAISTLTVEPLDICEKEAADEFEVEGYFCENGNEPDMNITVPVLTQGELVKVCVRPVQNARESFIRMRNIRSFDFELSDDSNVKQAAVVGGNAAPNGLSQLWCTEGYAICHFETILYAAFFARPGLVLGSGVADMQFGGERAEDSVSPKGGVVERHLEATDEGDEKGVRHHPQRYLQQADEGPSAVFEMEMTVAPSNDYFLSSSPGVPVGFPFALTTLVLCTIIGFAL